MPVLEIAKDLRIARTVPNMEFDADISVLDVLEQKKRDWDILAIITKQVGLEVTKVLVIKPSSIVQNPRILKKLFRGRFGSITL